MRKTIAVLIALVSLAAAGTASADVPTSSQQIITSYPSAGEVDQSCATPGTLGTFMPSIGGFYHDGCTTKLRCSSLFGCGANTFTFINRSSTSDGLAPNVSQNARIRVFDANGALIRFHDKSCYGTPRCGTSDWMVISFGQSVSIQCNGVDYMNTLKAYYNYCQVDMHQS
jgi:hypothetical protein